MAGMLLAHLHDSFTQVGIDDFHAVRFEERIQPAFFGQHRFALDDLLNLMLLQNPQDDLVVFGRIAGPMHVCSLTRGVFFKLLQVIGDPGDHVGFDLRRGLPERFQLGQRMRLLVALGVHEPQRFIVPMRPFVVGYELGRLRRMI